MTFSTFKGAVVFVAILVCLVVIESLTGLNMGVAVVASAIVFALIPAVWSELADWRTRRWQFSLRSLLLITTLIAAALGLSVWLLAP